MFAKKMNNHIKKKAPETLESLKLYLLPKFKELFKNKFHW